MILGAILVPDVFVFLTGIFPNTIQEKGIFSRESRSNLGNA